MFFIWVVLDTTLFFMYVLFHVVLRVVASTCHGLPTPLPPPATQSPAAVWGRPEGGTDAAVAGPGASSITIALGYGVPGRTSGVGNSVSLT